MTRKITRTGVDIYNANFIYRMMNNIMPMTKGMTRALQRMLDWINWGDHIKFVVKLRPFIAVDIERGGDRVEYDNQGYEKFRSVVRHQTDFVDSTGYGNLPLINNEQFQLRLLFWAENLYSNWLRAFQKYPAIAHSLGMTYVQDTDGEEDGTIFYVPQWRLEVPENWQVMRASDKVMLAQAIQFMANEIDAMYDNLIWLDADDTKTAEIVLRRCRQESEDEDQAEPELGEPGYDLTKGTHLDLDAALSDWGDETDAKRRDHAEFRRLKIDDVIQHNESLNGGEISKEAWESAQAAAYAHDTSFSLPG